MSDPVNALLGLWKKEKDAMDAKTAKLDKKIADLQEKRAEVQAPYLANLNDIEAEVRPLIEHRGKTMKIDGVTASHRKGQTRVTYNWQMVDRLLKKLEKLAPKTAEKLAPGFQAARKETTGKSSVSLKRVK